ncbi:putative oxidoreductase [Gracilariopsis chorda]|uniref:Putative oxidoreductase n=1 Tax=Gracilariopsis chorda TaxID=448386 RepID=A0A2V3IY66_9FLOR|nr:putative oxidoreductase [Gracilariopsis chorda]|eukprot:PXF47092.1 putative oxidoreductase [Gracilariopsis chorda]
MAQLPLLLLPLLATLAYFLRRRRHRHALRTLRAKHVWLVGASRGIGRATALHLASLGAKLTISSRPSPSLNQLADQLDKNLVSVVPFDVTDRQALAHAVRSVLNGPPIDVVIANAGINHDNLPFSALSETQVDRVLDTNFRSVAHLFSLLLPHLKQRPDALLCAISSMAAYRGVNGGSVYSASKAALTTFCQALDVELYHSSVSVVCVHPGFVLTSAISHLKNPKPFLLTPHQAAVEIVNAIAMKYSHYGFPWLMEHVVLPFSTCVPTSVYNYLMPKLSTYG